MRKLINKLNAIFYKLIIYPKYKLVLKKISGGGHIGLPLLITPRCISLGKNVYIKKGARIEGVSQFLNNNFNPSINIEDDVSIEQNLHLTCANKIQIGKNTAIASNVTITDINHPYTDINLAPERQPIEVTFVKIGEDCKIYNNVVILPSSIIGKHTIIGANSVVMGKTYPDFCVLVGAPAKIIKRYNFDTKNWQKTNADGEFI
jgi:acetyltransferase-like isoleucine patch superfamily enzyme